jgi:UDP-2,4-diacetamido-2,4,6-trideoxy-beta-L-altropyranose hydrolase
LEREADADDAAASARGARRTLTQAEDARRTAIELGAGGCDWLVVDHYGLDAAWEAQLRGSARHIFAIDDLPGRRHQCDLLLDQNLRFDADISMGGRLPDHSRALFGPRYALLREEFATARRQVKCRSGDARRVLVCFGGGDATDRTTVALEALRKLNRADLAVDVVIGSEHAHRERIDAACRSHRFTLHVDTQHMAQLMAKADLAIGAGGSATWERCCLGLPTLALPIAENQRQVVRDCALSGVLYAPADAYLGADELADHLRFLLGNALLREAMSRRALALVDGRGAARVTRALGIFDISLRRATLQDARSLFEWRNHPAIRAASRSPQPFDWSEHHRWLDAVLHDPHRVLLIGEAAGIPMGVVRFDISVGKAEVSIYAVPDRHERASGSDLLAGAERWLLQHRPDVTQLNAEVLGENARSHGLFAAGDYQRNSTRYSKRIK